MDYKKVIEDFNNGEIDFEKFQVVMDNDGGYWKCIDDDLSDDQRWQLEDDMKSKYGTPDGYNDIVVVLNAAGVNVDWC